MRQLRLDDGFAKVIEDIPFGMWKCKNDIPEDIMNFIYKCSRERAIYEESSKKFFCSKCFSSLNSDYYCDKCNLQYANYDDDLCNCNFDEDSLKNVMSVNKIDEIKDMEFWYRYYVFDVVYDEVILYVLLENIYYDNPLVINAYKTSNVEIDGVYGVSREGLTDFINNCVYLFSEYEGFFSDGSGRDYNSKIFNLFEIGNVGMLYSGNLDKLKSTIYKYTFLWEIVENINKGCITLAELTYIPLCKPEFEYLVKMKLFNLALGGGYALKKGKTFKERFGVDKKYLPFMVKNDITNEQLLALQLYPTEDLELLRFISNNIYIFKRIIDDEKIKIDFKRLREYFRINGLGNEYLFEYADYLSLVKKLGYDLRNKRVLYPSNLLGEHDKLYLQAKIMENPKIDEKIKNLSNALRLNYYEDDKYIIYPAGSVKALLDESMQQNNCVRTYCDKYAENESQIYFMRLKNDSKNSLVTIEVYRNKVIQARVKNNGLPSKEITDVLDKWEREIVPVLME